VPLFHITTRAAWDAATVAGVYVAPSLAREGFIHLSTEAQVPGTLRRFFAGQTGLVLLVIAPDRLAALGTEVRFEAADGDAFPHLYGPLALDAVVEVRAL
jgi:uncharacterized protein (DUF952 family)